MLEKILTAFGSCAAIDIRQLVAASHNLFLMADGHKVVLYPTPSAGECFANIELLTGCTFRNIDVPVTELRVLAGEGAALDQIETLAAQCQPSLAHERITDDEGQPRLRIARK